MGGDHPTTPPHCPAGGLEVALRGGPWGGSPHPFHWKKITPTN